MACEARSTSRRRRIHDPVRNMHVEESFGAAHAFIQGAVLVLVIQVEHRLKLLDLINRQLWCIVLYVFFLQSGQPRKACESD